MCGVEVDSVLQHLWSDSVPVSMGRQTKINFSVGDLIKFRKHGPTGRLLFSVCTVTYPLRPLKPVVPVGTVNQDSGTPPPPRTRCGRDPEARLLLLDEGPVVPEL